VALVTHLTLTISSTIILLLMRMGLIGGHPATCCGTGRVGMVTISFAPFNVICAGFATCNVGTPWVTMPVMPSSSVAFAGLIWMFCGGESLTPSIPPSGRQSS
jgi:hypothetical protein